MRLRLNRKGNEATMQCHICNAQMQDIDEYDFIRGIKTNLAECKACKRQVVLSQRAIIQGDILPYLQYRGSKRKRFIGRPVEYNTVSS